MDEIQYSKWILGLANQIRRMYNISTDNNGAQTRILYFVLANYPERDIYQKDLEEELNVQSASVSVLLKKLEKEGLITRERAPDDNRLKRIRPTPAGIERQRAVNYDIQHMENKLTVGISKKQLKIFYEVIQKMMENTS